MRTETDFWNEISEHLPIQLNSDDHVVDPDRQNKW